MPGKKGVNTARNTVRSKQQSDVPLSIDESLEKIILAANAYWGLKSKISNYEKQIKQELRPQLEKYLKDNKPKSAEGSYTVDLPDYLGNKLSLVRTVKLGESYDLGTPEEFKIAYPKLAKKVVKKVEVINYELLQEMILSGEVSEDAAKELVTITKSFSFAVKKRK